MKYHSINLALSSLCQRLVGRVAALGGLVNIGLLVLLLGSFTVSAEAQVVRMNNPAAVNGRVWVRGVGYQLAGTLTSPIDEQRSRAFQLVIELAHRQPEINLKSTVPVLVDIYKSDPNEIYRLGAVGALYAIGDESGMQQMRRHIYRQTSRRVQMAAIGALLDYYGTATFENDETVAALAEALRDQIRTRQEQAAQIIAGQK